MLYDVTMLHQSEDNVETTLKCLLGNNLKSKVQEFMLEKGGSIEHIEEWSSKHEAEVQENDAAINELQKRTK